MSNLITISSCRICSQQTSCLYFLIARRFKSKKSQEHSFKVYSKKTPTNTALKHFDDFYSSVFGDRTWSSIRLALLSLKKPCALVNNFSDIEETSQKLLELGCLDVGSMLSKEKKFLAESQKEEEEQPGAVLSNMQGEEVTESHDHRVRESIISRILEQEHSDDTTFDEHDRIIQPQRPGLNIKTMSPVLSDFVPVKELKGLEDWVDEADYFTYYQEDEGHFPITIVDEKNLNYPNTLKNYVFSTADVSLFPSPSRTTVGTFDYYVLDAASILPVLALDLQPNDEVLDICAAPGGKTLAILQSLIPKKVTACDCSRSRMNRLKRTMKMYIPPPGECSIKFETKVLDGSTHITPNGYDKILVDVPCTNDRLSVKDNLNNIFHSQRIKERVKIPDLQTKLLSCALKSVRVGGSVVYSTCTMSPIQNDGVVFMALKKLWEETKCEFVVRDLTNAVLPFQFMFRLHDGKKLRYGQLILPSLMNNFGPMYFSKLVRVK